MTKRDLIRTLFYGFMLIFLVYFGIQFNETRKEIAKNRKIKNELKEESHLLDLKLEKLRYDLKNYTTIEFIERTAREKGMIKPRDILIKDLDKNDSKGSN